MKNDAHTQRVHLELLCPNDVYDLKEEEATSAMVPHEVLTNDHLTTVEVRLGFRTLNLKDRLPSSPLFDVFKVSTTKGPGVLKLARKEPREKTTLSQFSNFDAGETSAFPPYDINLKYTSCTPSDLAERLLRDEAARIARSRGAWNHEVWSIERISGSPTWSAGMLMPEHPGTPLSDLTTAQQRQLFPRLLPALWEALGASPHHDLRPQNLIISPNHARFALIDPGGQAYYESIAESLSYSLLTVTNDEHYPFFAPQWPVTVMPHASLAEHYDAASKKATAPLRRGSHTCADGLQASDLHALGLMYARILTGTTPYEQVPKPGWFLGKLHSIEAPLEALQTPRIRGCGRSGISHQEASLMFKLLSLEIRTKPGLYDALDAFYPG